MLIVKKNTVKKNDCIWIPRNGKKCMCFVFQMLRSFSYGQFQYTKCDILYQIRDKKLSTGNFCRLLSIRDIKKQRGACRCNTHSCHFKRTTCINVTVWVVNKTYMIHDLNPNVLTYVFIQLYNWVVDICTIHLNILWKACVDMYKWLDWRQSWQLASHAAQ